MLKKNLVLLGMMAVGKTTLGRIVAKRQGVEFADIDENIEKKNSIIAVGGGSFVNKSIREYILKNAISFWLDIDIKTLNKRVKWNKKRPLLSKINNIKKLNNLYTERKKIYKLADHRIECDQLTKENIVKKIISLYEKY